MICQSFSPFLSLVHTTFLHFNDLLEAAVKHSMLNLEASFGSQYQQDDDDPKGISQLLRLNFFHHTVF